MTIFDELFDFNRDGYADAIETAMGCMILDELEEDELPDDFDADDFGLGDF